MKAETSLARTTSPNTITTRLRTACAAEFLPLLLLLTLPAVVQAQFTFTTNNGAITITGYTGSGGAVVIPSTTNGLRVTSIGYEAFYEKQNLVSVTIPDSVTSLGTNAFQSCTNLASVTVGSGVTNMGSSVFDSCTSLASVTMANGVTTIGDGAFDACTSLASLAIPSSVTNIGVEAFFSCTSLTNVVIGKGVTYLGELAFGYCSSLISVYFTGNAPAYSSFVFYLDGNATAYYMPGTTNWSSPFATLPAVLWNPQVQASAATFGVRTNRFGFTIIGTSNLVIVVEASTNVAKGAWSPVGTNTLTGGSSYFSDARWTNYTRRFYRLRSP